MYQCRLVAGRRVGLASSKHARFNSSATQPRPRARIVSDFAGLNIPNKGQIEEAKGRAPASALSRRLAARQVAEPQLTAQVEPKVQRTKAAHEAHESAPQGTTPTTRAPVARRDPNPSPRTPISRASQQHEARFKEDENSRPKKLFSSRAPSIKEIKRSQAAAAVPTSNRRPKVKSRKVTELAKEEEDEEMNVEWSMDDLNDELEMDSGGEEGESSFNSYLSERELDEVLGTDDIIQKIITADGVKSDRLYEATMKALEGADSGNSLDVVRLKQTLNKIASLDRALVSVANGEVVTPLELEDPIERPHPWCAKVDFALPRDIRADAPEYVDDAEVMTQAHDQGLRSEEDGVEATDLDSLDEGTKVILQEVDKREQQFLNNALAGASLRLGKVDRRGGSTKWPLAMPVKSARFLQDISTLTLAETVQAFAGANPSLKIPAKKRIAELVRNTASIPVDGP